MSQALIDIVRKLDEHSLRYQVELDPAYAVEFFRQSHDACADLIDAINSRIPPKQYEPGNPNNGHPHHKFLIGREYSRVIYVSVVHAYLKDVPETTMRLEREFRRLAKRFECDEIDTDWNEGETRWRFWWD